MSGALRTRAAVLLLAVIGAPAVAARPAGVGFDTPLVSANVTLLGNIPEAGAVGGRVRELTDVTGQRKRYFVMTSARGVSVYDVTVPEAPVFASHLPLPHWENEDVDFGGDKLIVSVDPGWFYDRVGGMYIIDISRLPALTYAYVNPATGNLWRAPALYGAGHTATCLRPDCSFVAIVGTGSAIADLRVPSAPRIVNYVPDVEGHDVQVDEAGVAWSGTFPFDTSDPIHPTSLIGSLAGVRPNGIQHNSWRPRAREFAPRSDHATDRTIRPGELLLMTGEEIWPPPIGHQETCINQGQFATLWIKDHDELATGTARTSIEGLDIWQTELAVAGRAAAALCSAHYFSERSNIVAIAWYEQGIRFLDVSDPRDIRQVGYYINPSSVAFSTAWLGPGAAGGEIIYTIDAARGIDVLRFDRTPAIQTVRAPILPQWLDDSVPPFARPHPRWGLACRIPGAVG